MQEDELDEVPGESDVPADPKAAASAALSGEDAGAATSRKAAPVPGAKRTLSNIAKGAIFREVVLAKVREMKEDEKKVQVEKDAQDKAAQRQSFQ